MSDFTRVIGTPLPGTKVSMPIVRPYPGIPGRASPGSKPDPSTRERPR